MGPLQSKERMVNIGVWEEIELRRNSEMLGGWEQSGIRAVELVMELLVSPRKKGESRLVRTKRSFYQNRPQKSWVRKYVRLILDSSIRNGTKSYPVPVNGLCPLFHKTLPEKTLTKSQLDVVNMSKPM